jgi:hypothetical protein
MVDVATLTPHQKCIFGGSIDSVVNVWTMAVDPISILCPLE